MSNSESFKDKLKKTGLNIIAKAKNGYSNARNSIEQNFLNDSLRKRFNLENPYKFLVMDDKEKSNFINELLPRHAKRYIEDDIFVFYGNLSETDVKVGYFIKDLSDESIYKVQDLATVKVRVTYEGSEYEVDGTAVYGKMI
ncbi:MAG: hypothetical protein WC152_04745 [Candidatus Izemoplasmatales bacterium]